MDFNTIEVLLVEDDLVDAELTIRELKKYRLANNLMHVSNGQDALDFVFAEGKFKGIRSTPFAPKLILMDIKMPMIGGIEVLKAIKSDERIRTIPIVMLTSSNEDPDRRVCYNLGANGYVVKPVSFESFAETIKDIGCYWLLRNQPPVKQFVI